MQEILKNVYIWRWWAEPKQMYFNGYFIHNPQGNIVIDPTAFAEEDLSQMKKLGGVEYIIITNKHHQRETKELLKHFEAQVMIHENDAAGLEIPIHQTFKDGEHVADLQVIAIQDSKTPGESALFYPDQKVLFMGDALIGYPKGKLSLLSTEKILDANKAKRALQVVLACNFEHLLMGDGEPLISNAKQLVTDFIEGEDAT